MKYKWFFDESGVLTECAPKLDNDTKSEFAPESGEMFYRAKLTNALTFQIEFDDILSKGYSHTHGVVLHRFDDSENDFVEVWRGKFTLTDCTINYDRKTIVVTPATIDRYTDILAAKDTEYNIVKLAPKMQPVNILVRPCMQIYRAGATKICNYVGGNGWEAECEPESNKLALGVMGFIETRDTLWFSLDFNSGPNIGKNTMYIGQFLLKDLTDVIFPIDGRIYNSDGTYTEDNSLECRVRLNMTLKWEVVVSDIATQTMVFRAWYNQYDSGDNYWNIEWASYIDNVLISWDVVYARTICDTELQTITIGGNTYTLEDLSTQDIIKNRNYNKVLPYAAAVVMPKIDTSTDPTTWPQDIFGNYFVKPANTLTRHYFAINPDDWRGVSYWWYAGVGADRVEELLTTEREIKDCYDLRDTIVKLLQKAGWNGQYVISGVFGSQGYVGNNLLPIITPKSNVISSYYDIPAQNAPISLAKIFSMLKQAYKVYWHIDENNNLHLEHISYYQNGYSYTELPQQLVDLESDLHTRTKHSKAYGQNVVKFDKSRMPGVISFGWMDKQTVPFDGYDIKALDAYIEQGLKEENLVGDFSTDVDFVLSSPNDVSKDGFFLFALPSIGAGVYSNTLKIEKINITDENGDNYDVTIQNADAAFCKIHKTFWRYNMPCENLQINNEPDTALTTGRFKTQTLEFADLSMADVIGDVDNCIKLIKTQQGYGAISKLSINLNSLSTTADLVFALMGRKYYLKGAALNGTITITLNGEQITINVGNNRFVYGYTEPINELKFAGTDVVSVDFADTDTLDNLTATDDMFKNCTELIAVNFANKTFGAVISANDMFKGCVNLVDLICPDSSSWKADLDFCDCPDLTTESLYDLIKFLYSYNAGVHTITPNTVMWNALDATVQNDLIAKATAKGWTINIPAAYSITGQSAANTVYATINGSPVEIPVTAGSWQYDYNGAVTSFSFANDADLTDIDFSLSDGLAGVTTLNNAFKNCSALTSVDFTNCDLSNVASASDCFAGCSALVDLTIPADTWKPDIDLSGSMLIVYSEMLDIIGGLYTYATGTHTITFNTTYWDSLSQAQQQTIFNAADAKGWTTNAVMVVYHIRGESTANTEDINYNGITITVPVINGNFDFEYQSPLLQLPFSSSPSTTITSLDFSTSCGLSGITNWSFCFDGWINLVSVDFTNCSFNNATIFDYMFRSASSLLSIEMHGLAGAQSMVEMFSNATSLESITLDKIIPATNISGIFSYTKIQTIDFEFPNVTNMQGFVQGCTLLKTATLVINNHVINVGVGMNGMFYNLTALQSVRLESTFEDASMAVQMFMGCSNLVSVEMPYATFASATNIAAMFNGCSGLTTLDLPNATFASATAQLLWAGAGMFTNCTNLRTLNMPKATFQNLTNSASMFGATNSLTDITCEQSTFPISVSFSASPLTYQSILNVANWLADLTGGTTQTITFKTSAWNALSSAEQATIQGILQSKNWNLATA